MRARLGFRRSKGWGKNPRTKKTPPKRGFPDCFPCDILFAPPSWQAILRVSLFCPLRFLRSVHVRKITRGSNRM